MKRQILFMFLMLVAFQAFAVCPTISFSLSQTPEPCKARTKITSTAATGGQGPYTYSIDGVNFQTGRNFIVTVGGTYTITAKDFNGCTGTQMITVAAIPSLLSVSVAKTNVLCHGQNTGAATATITGGQTPYIARIWQNTSTGNIIALNTNTVTGLGAGPYQILVVDANGCVKATNFNITQPQLLVLTLQESLYKGGGLWKVTLSASGGTGSIGTRLWRRCDSGGMNCTAWQSSRIFDDTPDGVYQFEVKDLNNCIATLLVSLVPPPAPSGKIVSNGNFSQGSNLDMKVYPNPVMDGTVQVELGSTDAEEVEILVVNSFGQVVLNLKQQLDGETALPISLQDLAQGMYQVVVRTSTGQTATAPLTKMQ